MLSVELRAQPALNLNTRQVCCPVFEYPLYSDPFGISNFNKLFFLQSWYHYYGTGLEPKVTLTIWTLLLVMFALGLAIGVVLAVGALLFFQVTQ